MNKKIILRNKEYLVNLHNSYIIKKSKEYRIYYIKRYKTFGKNKLMVRRYIGKKISDIYDNDDKYNLIWDLIQRLDFMINDIKQYIASQDIYTDEYYKKISQPVTIEEINNINVEDYI